MAAFAHNPGVHHKYSIAAYPRKAEMGGGYRGVILNKDTKEKKESPVLDTLSAATYWAKKAAHDAAGSSLADIAAMRVKGEYRANVWVKAGSEGNPDSRRAQALKEAQQLYRVRKDSTGRALTASEIAANQQRAARLIASMPNPKPVSEMTAGEINKALDKVDTERSKITDEFIATGRGYETPSEYLRASDPLALRAQRNQREHDALHIEIERRYGPGAPSRLPKGFGPIMRRSNADLPKRDADTMSDAIAMSSPSGRQSKRGKEAARKRLATTLFGEGGLQHPQRPEPTTSEKRALLLQRAGDLRLMASREMKPRAFVKEAERLEREASAIENPERLETMNETDNTDSIAELAFSKGLEMGRELSEMESGESGSGEVVVVSNPSQWLKLYSGLSFNQAELRVKKIKGDEAKLRKLGGMGNYSNVEARLVFEGPGRKEYGVFVSPLRRNPESAASELYESFHGAPPTEVLEYHSEEHEHSNYAGLGDLIELKVITPFGKEATITSADPSSAPLQDVVKLCSNEDGTQLYFIGGDQGIDTKALGFKDRDEKDCMVLGVLIELTYRTGKHFHKFEPTDYWHKLGEESGEQPMLLYYPRNPSIAVAGGAYQIKPEGIVD